MRSYDDCPSDYRRRFRLVRTVAQFCDTPKILRAIEAIPRHFFVPEGASAQAYEDHAVAIGAGQTISQPSLIAQMLYLLDLQPGDRVLDVGSGSGYVSCLLAHLVGPDGSVLAIERQENLVAAAQRAHAAIEVEGLAPITWQLGDALDVSGARFDAIHIACTMPEEPDGLLAMLEEDAHLVGPIAEDNRQILYDYHRSEGGLEKRALLDVLFVPLLRGVVPNDR